MSLRSSVSGSPAGALRDVGDADLGLVLDRERALRVLGGELELLERVGVLAHVHAVLRHELVGEQVDHAVVEVVAAEVRVAAGREHLEDVLPDLEDRDVEGAAAEVVHRDALGEPAAEAVRERRRGGLVQEAQHLEARDAPGVLGRLALVVVEVGRHGDHGLRDRLPDPRLGHELHLLQHHRRDFGQREQLVPDADAHAVTGAVHDLVGVDGARLLHLLGERVAADQALGGSDGVMGVVDQGGPRGVSHHHGAGLGEVHDARGDVLAVRVGEHLHALAARHGHARVAGPQIDADGDLRHGAASPPGGEPRGHEAAYRPAPG